MASCSPIYWVQFMLPYTKQYFEELITSGRIREIDPSTIWYLSRPDFGEDRIGTKLISRPDRGFELLQGPPVFPGEILGGMHGLAL